MVAESLTKSWTADTNEAFAHEAFDASWVELRFVALLKCDNAKCKEPVVVGGSGRVEESPNEDLTRMDYEELFIPTYVFPPPRLIALPPDAPSPVVEELNQAFTASWNDYASAANRIRAAAEHLMDALKIPKTTVNSKGKRELLKLHSRIDKTKAKYPATHQSLLAVKWLGNAGSHSTALTRDAVFDALDIFEAVLHELYSSHPRALKKLVSRVIARKGPTHARKGKAPISRRRT